MNERESIAGAQVDVGYPRPQEERESLDIGLNLGQDNNDHDDDDDDLGEEPEPRRRRINPREEAVVQMRQEPLRALERRMNENPVMTRTRAVTIAELEMDAASPDMNRTGYLDLMLLRAIANGKSGQTYFSVKQMAARGNKKEATKSSYSRLFLMKVMNSTEAHQVVYLVENKGQNERLWLKNASLRDDGTISIGTIIRVFYPLPIESHLGDMAQSPIPSIITRFPAIVMKTPSLLMEVNINSQMTGNATLAFCLNSCEVQVLTSTPEDTGCAGFFCDKQRIQEVGQYRQGCVCYVWADRKNSMIIDHSLKIRKGNWDAYIPNYSSIRFSMLYQTNVFSGQIRRDELELSEKYFELVESIGHCMDFINANGGFTIVGWYKRGMVNDRTILSLNEGSPAHIRNLFNNETPDKVDSGKMNYHPCYILPTNRALLDPNHDLGKELKNLQFDVTSLSQLMNINA